MNSTARRFDSTALRIIAYLAWLVPVAWTVGTIYGRLSSSFAVFSIKHVLVPVWIMVLPVMLYYGHLLISRFQLSLAAFVALILIWGNATGVAWAFGGYESGISVCVGLGAVLCHGVVWGESVSKILGVWRRPQRVALSILGVLMPIAIWMLAPGLLYACLAVSTSDGPMFILCSAISLAAAGIILLRGWIHRRACRTAAAKLA